MKTINKNIYKLLNIMLGFALPVGVFLIFVLLSGGRMLNSRTIMTTLRQSVQPAIICYALMLGMSIDMMNWSCGAIVVCSAICGSGIANSLGWGLPGFLLMAVLIAMLCCALLGLLYNFLRVPCMVLTLGSMLVYEAIPRIIFPSGAKIQNKDAILSRSPYCFIVMLIMMLIFFVLYNKTAFGHNIRAIGANQVVAVSAGIDIDKIKFTNFVIGGAFLGIAAVIYLSAQGSLDNVASMGSMAVMMDGFMGVYLGMLLARWIDMSAAIYLGVVTMKIISNGFVAVGLNATLKDVIVGIFLLVIMAASANAALPETIKANKEFALKANQEYASVGKG